MPFNDAGVFRAGGTIAPSSFVKVSTAADNTALQCSAATDVVLGIAQVGMKRTPGLAGSDTAIAAQAGDVISIFSLGDVAPIQLGTGGCTRGDLLTSDSSGFGVTASTGNEVGAQALQSGTVGAQVLSRILCRKA